MEKLNYESIEEELEELYQICTKQEQQIKHLLEHNSDSAKCLIEALHVIAQNESQCNAMRDDYNCQKLAVNALRTYRKRCRTFEEE